MTHIPFAHAAAVVAIAVGGALLLALLAAAAVLLWRRRRAARAAQVRGLPYGGPFVFVRIGNSGLVHRP